MKLKLLLTVLLFAGVAAMVYSDIQKDNLYLNEPAKIIEKVLPYQAVEGSGRSKVSATQYDVRIMWLKDGAEEFIKLDGRTYQLSVVCDTISHKRCQNEVAKTKYELFFGLGFIVVAIAAIVLFFTF